MKCYTNLSISWTRVNKGLRLGRAYVVYPLARGRIDRYLLHGDRRTRWKITNRSYAARLFHGVHTQRSWSGRSRARRLSNACARPRPRAEEGVRRRLIASSPDRRPRTSPYTTKRRRPRDQPFSSCSGRGRGDIGTELGNRSRAITREAGGGRARLLLRRLGG
jgi:hypothetical protein